MGQKDFDDVGMTCVCRGMQRAVAGSIPGIDLRAFDEKQIHQFSVARECRQVQRRLPLDPPRVHGGLICQ
jgi:hypothetical protein